MNKELFITRDQTVFPKQNFTTEAGRSISVKTITSVSRKKSKDDNEGYIVITSQKDPNIDDPTIADINCYATYCKLEDVYTNVDEDGNPVITIEVKGIERVLITNISKKNGVLYCDYERVNSKPYDKKEISQSYQLLMDMINSANVEKNILTIIKSNEDPVLGYSVEDKINLIASFLAISKKANFNHELNMEFMAELDVKKQIDILCRSLMNQNIMIDLDNKVMAKVNKALAKQQKEFYLREKLRVIKEEIGELNSREYSAKNLRKKVETNPYPEHIKKRALSEINRLESASNPNDYSISQQYLEWLLDIPYWQKSEDNSDIKKVEEILNKNHYGLEKVKERIVEYLATRVQSPNAKSPIMCLVGPPGVGKSSLAKSIAEALNKHFVKMSLGGVKDESEIRGHRKTYIGAMPGRIIKAMKKAEVINPLFLLDEIDKMSSDHRGDPASAMLEVLDPEQNSRFSDNYLEEDYDLSKVMFVATANYAEQIPAALYDRLEIIELTSYTEKEKLEIAKKHIIPKLLKELNLEGVMEFEDKAIQIIINRYTREAGVRELNRLIEKIIRKFIVEKQKTNIEKITIDESAVRKYLSKPIYDYNTADKIAIPGVVNGMAYTSAGGDLLPIEVTTFKGKGNIVITGNLKETMKESANVALGYVKANADKFGIKDVNFQEIDIHIHVPSGGIPKDGPSAGVTLTTAIISCLSNRSVSTNIAMTGEITLRGRVLIIGGVKEKVISAFRGGVNKIFMPKDDERFLDDIPKEVREKIDFHLVEKYDEIYHQIFDQK